MNRIDTIQFMTEKQKIAVFDFDGTIIEGSSPSWLVNRLIFERKISPLTSLKIGFWGIAYKWHLPQNESWVRGQVFKAFKGKSKQETDAYLINFYNTYIKKRIRPFARKALEDAQAQGCKIVVVSATFEPIILCAMQDLPIDYQVSTKMKVASDDTYTCEVDGEPIEGTAKIKALKDICNAQFGKGGWELEYAYGDHHSDIPLLELAKRPYAVCPNSSLERAAKRRGWPILDWEIAVSKQK